VCAGAAGVGGIGFFRVYGSLTSEGAGRKRSSAVGVSRSMAPGSVQAKRRRSWVPGRSGCGGRRVRLRWRPEQETRTAWSLVRRSRTAARRVRYSSSGTAAEGREQKQKGGGRLHGSGVAGWIF
jgi:hypothetical protein